MDIDTELDPDTDMNTVMNIDTDTDIGILHLSVCYHNKQHCNYEILPNFAKLKYLKKLLTFVDTLIIHR
jgi:hypothetical protein